PVGETVTFNDLIRGEVGFDTSLIDDKVLLKADGMPTYHLAVVVDDYLMKITHAFRGEEWLPSSPVHILLWKHLFGLESMPKWAHLPLILGPNGKLSKRDGAKYGFPVFAMTWTDPATGETTEGFREKGFLPEAFINLLAMIGWNDGTDKEIFTKEELIKQFSIERVQSAGAKFDYEKAKWFNHEWIKRLSVEEFKSHLLSYLDEKDEMQKNPGKLAMVIELVKDRCILLSDFHEQAGFFFNAPQEFDLDSVRPKWTPEKKSFLENFMGEMKAIDTWESAFIEDAFKKMATSQNIKPGELQMPFRIMLVGRKFGPPVFDIVTVLGKEEVAERIRTFLSRI